MPTVTGKRKFNQINDNITSKTNTWSSSKIDSTITGSTGGLVGGPVSSTDNSIPRYDGTTGKLLQDSQITITDSGILHPNGDGTQDLGSSTNEFKDGYFKSIYINEEATIPVTNPIDTTNTVSGVDSGVNLSGTSNGNTLLGYKSGEDLGDNSGNTFIGRESGMEFTSVDTAKSKGNVGVGEVALKGSSGFTNGSWNVGVGVSSGVGITTGERNTLIGTSAGSTINSGSNNTSIGSNSVIDSSSDNQTALGYGSTCTTGNQIVLGNSSVTEIRSGSDEKCSLGTSSYKFSNIHGSTFQGTQPFDIGLRTDLGGTGNLLCNESSTFTNIEVGAVSNTIIGDGAGDSITTGSANVFIGVDTGKSKNTCSSCVFVGDRAGENKSDGLRNVGIGALAGRNFRSSNNIGIGYSSGITIETGNSNLMLGANTDGVDGKTNQIAIGTGAVTTDSNQMVLGNASITMIRPMSDGVCDLGTSSNKFKNGYFGGVLQFEKPWFEMYQNVTTTTTITTQNVWYKVAFTSTTANSNNEGFTHTSPNKITYDGSMTKNFHCGVTISANPSSPADHNYEFAIFKNGVEVPGSTVLLHMIDSGHDYSTAIHSIPVMATNDYLELYVRRTTSGSQDILVSRMNFFGLALPNLV